MDKGKAFKDTGGQWKSSTYSTEIDIHETRTLFIWVECITISLSVISKIDNKQIERVNSVQYMGATFTSTGDGTSDIQQRLVTTKQHL